MSDSVNIGAKYYKYEYNERGEPNLLVYRLKEYKNNSYYLIDENKKKHFFTKDTFRKWTKLLPHGYISFTTASLNGNPDVIASFTTTDDILDNNGKYYPSVVCRQALIINGKIGNIISNINSDDDITRFLFSEKKPDNLCTIAIYRDDSLDDILSFIKSAPYDANLYKLKHKSDLIKILNVSGLDTEQIKDNLKDFLIEQEFIKYVQGALGVNQYNYPIDLEDKDNLNETISNIFRVVCPWENYRNPMIMEYSSEYINLEEIKRKFFLVRSSNNKTFVIVYS